MMTRIVVLAVGMLACGTGCVAETRAAPKTHEVSPSIDRYGKRHDVRPREASSPSRT